MRRPPRLFALIVVLPALLLSGTSSSAITSPRADKLYLLSSDAEYLYWSPDAADPELGVGTLSRMCGTNYIGVDPKPCLMGINASNQTRTFNLSFMPAASLGEEITWSAGAPLRFHIEGNINTFGVPYTVQLVLQKGSTAIVSNAATQTAPGVWDGQISSGAPMNLSDVNLLVVRVTTQAPAAMVELRLGGRSYLELPRPFAMHGVPDLVRAETFRPEPSSFRTGTRTFAFNDRNWATQSFTGRTGAVREFPFTLPAKAEVLLAWVEVLDRSFAHTVRSGSPDPQTALHGASVAVLRDGEEIDHSGGGAGAAGIGTEALAALDVAPGPLTLTVTSANKDEGQSVPFAVHVLEVRGERTLQMMRWRFMQGQSSRLVATATCPRYFEPVPATDEVRSVALDLDWDSVSPLPKYTLQFDLPGIGSFPCGEAGIGDELRFTFPAAERVSYVGAVAAYDSIHATAHDTVFEMTARYIYSAPPAA